MLKYFFLSFKATVWTIMDNNSRIMTNKGRKATANNFMYKKYSFPTDVKN